MLQPQFGNCLGHIFRLMRVQQIRPPGGHIAKGAGACANRSKDHHGGMFFGPAFTNVRTCRLFTDRNKIKIAHQGPSFAIGRRNGSLDAQPVWPARLRPVRVPAFLRVALCAFAGVELRHLDLAFGAARRAPYPFNDVSQPDA